MSKKNKRKDIEHLINWMKDTVDPNNPADARALTTARELILSLSDISMNIDEWVEADFIVLEDAWPEREWARAAAALKLRR